VTDDPVVVNPEVLGMQFMNAQNQADQGLWVEFFSQPSLMELESEKQGRPIYRDQDYIKIIVPGDKYNIHVSEVSPGHKARFPLHWARYQAQQKQHTEGTSVEQWAAISKSFALELKALGFHTVEQIATASDASLQPLMGGLGWRTKAQAYISAAKDSGHIQHQAAELERQKAANAALQAQIDELRMAIEEKRGPGRPRKEAA